MQRIHYFRWTLLGGIAMALGVLFYFIFNHTASPPSSANAYPPIRPVTEFELRDTEDQPFTLANLKGRWSVLFFGYTSCPDICPTTLAELSHAAKLLEDAGQPLPQFIFISLDPERDTSQHLQEYVTYFHPLFKGVTGSQEQLDAIIEQLGIVYRKVPVASNQSSLNYLIDHSATLLIINPQAWLQGVITPPHEASFIAQEIINLYQTHR